MPVHHRTLGSRRLLIMLRIIVYKLVKVTLAVNVLLLFPVTESLDRCENLSGIRASYGREAYLDVRNERLPEQRQLSGQGAYIHYFVAT